MGKPVDLTRQPLFYADKIIVCYAPDPVKKVAGVMGCEKRCRYYTCVMIVDECYKDNLESLKKELLHQLGKCP